MRSKLFQVVSMIVALTGMVPSFLFDVENPGAGSQGSGSVDQKYVGEWVGSYVSGEGNTDKISYTLSKDENGRWRGTVKWVDQYGEHTADFKSLQIEDGKMKGKVESPDGQAEIAIEGQFRGDKLEGTYAVSPKGSTEVADKGSWKVAKSAAPKTGQ
jgi:hypothetical protein